MLSIATLSAGSEGYYLKSVADGVEDYYLGHGEAPGRWLGQGSAGLGLSGEVDAEALRAVLGDRDPHSGSRLSAGAARKVVGYDATFCAPKSVSVLYALGSPEVAAQVRDAHDVAVRDALGTYERVASRARRGHAGSSVLEADGFVAAGFRHRTSRAGDPHLHTHVLIGNVVHAPFDDRWSSLDARNLYRWAKPVGHVYEAKLRAELTRRLGVEWGPVRNGIADIAAVPRPLLRAFSQRRVEIQSHLEAKGFTSARAAQYAAYQTRLAKPRDLKHGSLVAEWRERAAELGVDRGTVARWTGHGRDVKVPAPSTPEAQGLYRALASPIGLTERRSSFDRRAVLQAAADSLPEGGDVAEVVALADGFLSSEHVTPLMARGRCGDVLRRLDGSVVPREADGTRYSTPELMRLEEALLHGAVARRNGHYGVAPQDVSDPVLRRHEWLSDEQRDLVLRLTHSGAGVEVVVGAAGTGKTAALAAAREAWQASGHAVVGCALAARAASELQSGAGIPASTIDRFIAAVNVDDGRLTPNAVVVVDEAGMVGTRQLFTLAHIAAVNHAKIVLVGDHRQLPEINAGGAFAALTRELRTAELRDNRRQVHSWERAALAQLRAGDPNQAIRQYLDAGRVTIEPDAAALRSRMIHDWWTARADGQDVLMVAPRRSIVDALNRAARDLRIAAGELSTHSVEVNGASFAVGDRVIAQRNDYAIGLLNGTRGTVINLDHATGSLVVEIRDQGRVDVPRHYVDAGDLVHGYATTIHKAQGATADIALVWIDDQSYREAAYTGLSRGRIANHAYVVTTELAEAHFPQLETGGAELLRQAVTRSAAQQLAVQHVTLEAPWV